MNNIEISHHLQEFSDLLEFKGENVFKINAYRKAARIIDQMTESVDDLSHDGKLMEIPGIGAGIAKDIQDLLETGRIAKYDQEKEGIPDSALELMAIGSLGPKTAAFLFKELHIKSVDELELAVKEKKLQGIPGYGAKKEENIRRGIELYREGAARMLLGTAYPIVESLLQYLKVFPVVKEAVAAGSFRRMKETVGDIDILCISDEPVKTIEYFNQYPDVEEVIGSGDTKSSIRLKNHLQVDLRVLEKDSFGAALQYFTGSKDHNVRIREIARQKGLKVNEYGVFRGDEKIAGKTEEDVYAALGLPWISPELREDNGEIQAAQNNTLPQLIEIKDIQGDLHCHTTWSDGRNSLEEMVDMARSRGYKYMAITDHSSSVKIANGLSPEELLEQGRVIRELNKKLKGFTILAGSEVDIKPDGSLDFPDDVLKQLDIVIVSLHFGSHKDGEANTQRILKALKNPYSTFLAHPTMRLMGERDPHPMDMEAVIQAAKETGTAMEINSSKMRLDLKDVHARRAHELGVMLAINTDSHAVDQFNQMRLGVGTARRGWVTASGVLNTWPLEKIKEFRKTKFQKLG